MSFVVASFYHFFDFGHFESERAAIKAQMVAHGLMGSILIAAEGINGTVAGSREGIDGFLEYLGGTLIKEPVEHKESYSERQPFKRPKVRLKKETISLGEAVDLGLRGEYVEPADWNALIADPDTIVLDTRNAYEVHLGTFEGAVDPKIKNFKQLPEFVRKTLADAKDKKIATFCTGGIRCEKFTPWLIEQGFKNVYHLKGGILKYLEQVPESESAWQGECFVFDGRVAVGHGLKASETASMCIGCGTPLRPEDKEHPQFIEDLQCGFCAGFV